MPGRDNMAKNRVAQARRAAFRWPVRTATSQQAATGTCSVALTEKVRSISTHPHITGEQQQKQAQTVWGALSGGLK